MPKKSKKTRGRPRNPTMRVGGKLFQAWSWSHTKTAARKEAKRVQRTHGFDRYRIKSYGRNYHRIFVRKNDWG